MSRFMSVVWVVQGLTLLLLAGVLLVFPETIPQLFDNCVRVAGGVGLECPPTPHGLTEGGAPTGAFVDDVGFVLASVQMLVPFLFVLALFSLQAFMREDLRVRRQMARVFAFAGATFVYLLLRPSTIHQQKSDLHEALLYVSSQPEGLGRVFWSALLLGGFALLLLLVVSNLAMSLWPLPRAARQLSGSADTRPPQLWILWLVQGVAFVGLALFLTTGHLERLVLGPGPFLHGDVLEDIHQLAPPLVLTLGLFSFTGMRASREWGWRACSRLFTLFYAAWFLTLLFTWQKGFNPLVLLSLVPMLALLGGNLAYWSESDSWFVEEVGEGPDGWILVDLLLGPLLLLRTLTSRRRALYARGVAARGTLQVTDYAHTTVQCGDLAHDFFPPHQAFEAKVRFSSEGEDDAGLATRGAALRLYAPRLGRFDLLLSTGAYSAAENIVQFSLLHMARGLGRFAERRLWRRYPRMREGLVAALRRAPASYTQLHYYAQTVRFWVARDGTRHLVRYRLVPDEREPREESGLERGAPGVGIVLERRRKPEERRPRNYLQQELKKRLEGPRTCAMRLEAQFHCPEPGDNNHWFNPAADWRTDAHPWVCIGQLLLQDVLPDELGEALRFNPASVPPSLGIPTSEGLFDYRSIADSEKRVHRRLQKTRQWMTESFGLPSPDFKPYDEP